MIVTDPPYGIGFSGVAAQMTGRNWIGCEIDYDMWKQACNWVNTYDKELAKEYIEHRIR